MSLVYGAPAVGGAVPLNTEQRAEDVGGELVPFFGLNPAAGAAVTSVSASTSAVTLLAANAGDSGRKGAIIINDSSAILYVKFGSGASSSSHTVPLYPKDRYELPLPIYQGIITGIWVTATGAARVTELA